jgi:hypothetical protein
MKVKYWTDTRTLEEFTGRTKAEIEAALAAPQPGRRFTPEQENRQKTEPEHHKYDIQKTPGVPVEESLVFRLFYLYGQLKAYRERFSLVDFMRHHEIETRAAIARLKTISFKIGWQAGFNEGLKVDVYRSEIFEQMELALQHKAKPEPEKPTLEAMFADKKHLVKLVEELTAKGFCNTQNGSLTWTGIKHHSAKTPKSQLIALAYALADSYKYKKAYTQKELWQAWTEYFNITIAQNMFSEAKRPAPYSDYYSIFANLINSLRYA